MLLQKARHDWLREEIVRLEGMKEDEPPHAGYTRVEASMYSYAKGRNQALQTIIDRYHSELDQLKRTGENGYSLNAQNIKGASGSVGISELDQDKQ